MQSKTKPHIVMHFCTNNLAIISTQISGTNAQANRKLMLTAVAQKLPAVNNFANCLQHGQHDPHRGASLHPTERILVKSRNNEDKSKNQAHETTKTKVV